MDNILKYDETTIGLACLLLALHVAKRIQEPASLVHPMLLGRQVDAANVRKGGESAVYRNFGVGYHSPLPTRPDRDIKTVLDFIQEGDTSSRSLWSTEITNAKLKERVNGLATGFLKTVKLEPRDSNVLVLLDDSLEFLITDLALASLSIPTLTITRLDILTQVIETYPPSAIIVGLEFLDKVLELVAENKESELTVIVLGDHNNLSRERSKKIDIEIVRWEDLLESGLKEPATVGIQPPAANDVFTVSFTHKHGEQPRGTQLTHQNMTAGVAVLKNSFPLSKPFSSSDTILSSHTLSGPFGRSLAYTALLSGSSFATLPSTSIFSPSSPTLEEILRVSESHERLSPTVLFVSNVHLKQITNAILNQAKQSWLFSYAWMQKTYQLNNGFLANDTIWDKLVFSSARTQALGRLGSSLSRLMVTGPEISGDSLNPTRLALSIPIVRAFTHQMASGPIFASHPLDLQFFPEDAQKTDVQFEHLAHSGPPAANVEVKLLGVDDASVEGGADPVGEVCVRGPSIGQSVPPPEEPSSDGWTKLAGLRAKISTSGTFKVRSDV